MLPVKDQKFSRAELDSLFCAPSQNGYLGRDHKAMRDWRYEKKRYEFRNVAIRGGGARECERRRIGGFYTLHARHGS